MAEPREPHPRTPARETIDPATGRPVGEVEATERKPDGRAKEAEDRFDTGTFTGGG